MFNLFPNALANPLVPEATPGTGSPILGVEGSGLGVSGAFSELLDTQTSLTEVLEELRGLLPAEEFSQLETLVEDGNLLPLAEIVAAFRQQISGLEVEQAATQPLPVSGLVPGVLKVSMGTPGNQTLSTPTIVGSTNIAAVPNLTAMPEAISATHVTGQAAAALDLDGQLTAALDLEGQSEEFKLKFNGESLRDVETAVAQTLQKEPAGTLLRPSAVMPEAGAVTGASPAAGLNPQSLIQPSGVAVSQATLPPMEVPPGEKGWDRSMGERILWMVGRQVQGAELKITPPQLGPIDIRISIQNDQASVTFAAQHAVVREALEAAIPRLREMLGENNLQLVNVDVNQRDGGEQRASSDFFHQSPSGEGEEGEAYGIEGEPLVEEEVRFYRSDGLVDDFA